MKIKVQSLSLKGFLITSSLLFLVSCSNRFSEYYASESNSMNGGFEESREGYPTNWYLYTNKAAAKGNFSLSLNTTDKVEGKQSLQFNIKSCSAAGGHLSPGFAKEFDARPGKSYLVRFYTKTLPNSKWVFNLSAVSAKKELTSKSISSHSGSGTWVKHEIRLTQAPEATKLRMEWNALSKGVFLIDGIEWIEEE